MCLYHSRAWVEWSNAELIFSFFFLLRGIAMFVACEERMVGIDERGRPGSGTFSSSQIWFDF